MNNGLFRSKNKTFLFYRPLLKSQEQWNEIDEKPHQKFDKHVKNHVYSMQISAATQQRKNWLQQAIVLFTRDLYSWHFNKNKIFK